MSKLILNPLNTKKNSVEILQDVQLRASTYKLK